MSSFKKLYPTERQAEIMQMSYDEKEALWREVRDRTFDGFLNRVYTKSVHYFPPIPKGVYLPLSFALVITSENHKQKIQHLLSNAFVDNVKFNELINAQVCIEDGDYIAITGGLRDEFIEGKIRTHFTIKVHNKIPNNPQIHCCIDSYDLKICKFTYLVSF